MATEHDTTSAIDPLVWRVHPARERPVAFCAALVVVGAFAWLSAELMEAWGWAVLGVAVPLAMLQRFFFPSHYRVDESGVEARHALSIIQLPWTQVRRFVHDSSGGYVSSRSRPSALDSLRGIHLLFAGNADQAAARIRQEMQRQCEQQESAHCAGRT